LSVERGDISAWPTDPCEKIAVIFRLLEVERQSEMRPPPACQRYAQSDASDCHYPQRRHIERSEPSNVCRKSILFGLHIDPPDPEGHADQAQYETDPLLDNNNRLGLSALLFTSSHLPHTLSSTRSALAAEVSNIFAKTPGAAIVALNRGHDFGRQCSACAWVSDHSFLHKLRALYIQYDFRYIMYIK